MAGGGHGEELVAGGVAFGVVRGAGTLVNGGTLGANVVNKTVTMPTAGFVNRGQLQGTELVGGECKRAVGHGVQDTGLAGHKPKWDSRPA